MIKVAKVIVLAMLFILGITFSMENTSWIVLRYYFGLETPPVPIFLLVMFSVLLGILLAAMAFIFDEISLKRALQEKERQIASLEKELQVPREGQGAGAGGARQSISY